jgi:3'-phosphoadenosine 5'-phosphosulfate sulfotransferase (PAPS reductase)/FAD synthetase
MGRKQGLREQQPSLFANDPHQIIARALDRFDGRILRRTALLSGGNDSTVLTHWLWHHNYIDEALHIDTGTGIYQTGLFVRRFCQRHAIPLQVYHAAPGEYRRMVTNLIGGFPGPAKHSLAYQRLKERPLKRYIADIKDGHARNSKVILFTGVRRSESRRRMGTTKEIDEHGAAVWVAPLIDWLASDLRDWRAEHGLAESDVAALLHLSGECMCGSFMKPGERDDLAWAYPEKLRWIEGLEAWARTLGIVRDRWGGEPGDAQPSGAAGLMCSDCQLRLELTDPTACPARPRVRVHHYGQEQPLRISARIHTPGRTPGPVALELHELAALAVDATGIYAANTQLGVWGENHQLKLTTPGSDTAACGPLGRLLAEHAGSQQTAIDLTCSCGCSKRQQKTCGHDSGLAVWAHSWAQDEHPLLTPGPIRVANHDMRTVFERVRIVNRILVLHDDPVARLAMPGDRVHRDYAIAAVWQVSDVGRFSELLITRQADSQRVEEHWQQHGIQPGRLVALADRDLYQPWVIPAHAVGEREPNPLPAEQLDHRHPRPASNTKHAA